MRSCGRAQASSAASATNCSTGKGSSHASGLGIPVGRPWQAPPLPPSMGRDRKPAMNRIDRRFFLASTAAAAVTPVLPAFAARAAKPDAAAEHMLAGVAEALLAEYPENASSLGLDKGRRAGLKSRLTDRTLDGRARHAGAAQARLARLRTVDRRRLGHAALLDLEVTETAHQLAADGFRFPYGDVAVLNQNWSYRNAPYVVAQNTGAFVEIPDFLDSNHQVKNSADAEAYLARIEQYAVALDGETERLRHDGAIGVIAPDFLLDKTLKQMKGGRAQPIGDWGLVTSLAKRTGSIGAGYGAR